MRLSAEQKQKIEHRLDNLQEVDVWNTVGGTWVTGPLSDVLDAMAAVLSAGD
jgi:hypothetical protein